MSKIKVGDIFPIKGQFLEVVSYVSHKEVIVKSLGVSEQTFTTRSDALRSGKVRNPFLRNFNGIGYIGIGEYSTGGASFPTLEYKAWSGMIQRTYNGVHICYDNCTVSPHWHNFQNFAKWYKSQEFYGKGYHLDKDLRSNGSKVYSEKTCCLIPVEINSLLAEPCEKEIDLPIGVHRHRRGRYKSSVRMNGKGVFLGVYDTVEEARKAFCSAKITYTNIIILDWKNFIDEGLGVLIKEKVMRNIGC